MTTYVAKVIALDGSIIADPLPSSSITFNKVLSFPSARRLGTFTIELIPPRGANTHYIHVYKQLDYMQRVEIYEEETVGTPIFTGHIIDKSSDLNSWSLSGAEWLDKLNQRRSGHYQTYPFIGTLVDMFQWALNVWDYTFFDDFTGNLSAWTQASGVWNIVDEELVATSAGKITTPLVLSTSQDNEFKVRIEFTTPPKADNWELIFTIFESGSYEWTLTLTHVANEDKTNFVLEQSGAEEFYRDAGEYQLPYGVISSVEFYIYDSAAQTCEVWLNSRQFMITDSVDKGFGGNVSIETNLNGVTFDNIIIFYREPMLLPGTIDLTATQTFGTGDYEPPQDTYFEILTFLADQLNYEWRTIPQAGAGNDLLDASEAVGEDLTGIVRFEEGINLSNLTLSTSGSKLTTWYRFSGQGNDVNMALAEIYDKSAIELYGIIENQLSNQRISTVELARQLASNQLVKVKDGNASLTANVLMLDTSPDFNVGDLVWLKANSPDFNQSVKIVEISYTSDDLVRRVTFEDFPRSRSNKIGQLDNDVGIINRGKSLNAANVILTFKPGSRFIDNSDSRFIYTDSGVSGNPAHVWTHYINSVPPFTPFSPWNGTLSWASEAGITCNISLATTALRLVFMGDGNIRQCQVQIDGVDANSYDMQRPSPTFAETFHVDFTGVDPGLHLFTFRKDASIDAQTSKYITIDGIILDSHLWNDIFLEGRSIESAYLTFTLSDTISTNRPGVKVIINGIDRTLALGGTGTGFYANQSRLNVSQYISAPGLHYIDFQFSNPVSGTLQTVDQLIEATLDVRLFV